jgi:putative ABC transport system permease protein
MVRLNGIPYTVVGRIRKKDQDSSYNGQDNERVLVPYTAMARDFPRADGTNVLSNLVVAPHPWVVDRLPAVLEARTGRIEDIDWPLEHEVRRVLARHHDFDPADRNAIAMWDTSLESLMFGRMIVEMKTFFSVVGIVTLALGGIGVMNIMLIAVRERTREIGVRKALGATTDQIQRQFFLEGFVLTMLSGAVGFGVALALCAAVNLLPMPPRFQGMVLTWQSGTWAVIALTAIGVMTSTYPARRAARLPPVEALRFEM